MSFCPLFYVNEKFRHKLKKARKTTRPFRYDLNQIPYDYIVEVTNRFKGLDLIDGVSEEIWIEEVSGDQYHAQEKEMQKGKMFALMRPYKQLRKEEKSKAKEKMKDIAISMQSSKK